LALAVLLAVVQYMLKQSVEGGAGNSYVFGFVMLALLTVSAPMADCRYLAERCLLNVLLLLLLYVADTRIHLVFLFAYACVFLFKNLKLTLASKLALTAAFTLVAGLIFKSYFSSMATEIFASDGNGLPQSFGLRVELWKAGLTIVRDVPGMGLGFESKMPEVIKLLPGHLSYIRFTHLHNMFIDAAVAMGIPALVLLSSVFIAAVYMMSALEGEIRWRGYAFLAMSVFHGSLGPLLTHDIVTAVFFVVLAIFASRLLPSTSHPD
jgi:O-antigen ligase